MRDEIGRALRVVGTVEDITKEKLDENALKEAHSRFDLAVAGASVGIWEIELPNGRMFVSDRLKEITGAPVLASEEADRFEGPNAILRPEDLPESIWITLKDPREFEGITSAVVGLDGVARLVDQRETVGQITGIVDWLQRAALIVAGVLGLAALLLVALAFLPMILLLPRMQETR